jgi:hypothetical protein
VAILANRATEQGFRLRVADKAEMLRTLGFEVGVYQTGEEARFIADLDRVSAALFYRVAAQPTVIAAILAARRAGAATYYDCDELIFAPEHHPRPIEAYHGLITQVVHQNLRFGAPLYRGAMSLCDYGVAPTRMLAEAMEPVVRCGTAFVVPNVLAEREPLSRVRAEAKAARLFCGCGELTFVGEGEGEDALGRALAELMRRRADVQVTFVGHVWLGARLEPFLDRINCLPFTADPEQYRAWLAECDVNLAAVPLDTVGEAKSEIRWLEAAAAGIPSVVSASRTAAETFEHGRTALLARGADEWLAAIERLISDPGLRLRVGAAARELAVTHYGPEAGRSALQAMLGPVRDSRGANRVAAL